MYAYAMVQLEIQGVIHKDAHVFAQEDFYQAETDVVVSTMNQISLNDGLKEVGREGTFSIQERNGSVALN